MSEHDPFAPKTFVTVKPARAPLARPPLDRMRRLGASTIVLVEVQRRWQPLDQAERAQAVVDLDALSDDELRHAFDEMEVEAVAAKSWPTANEDDLAAAQELLADVPDASVKRIMAWVNDSLPRAVAALAVELRQPPNQQRTTLIDAVQDVLNDVR